MNGSPSPTSPHHRESHIPRHPRRLLAVTVVAAVVAVVVAGSLGRVTASPSGSAPSGAASLSPADAPGMSPAAQGAGKRADRAGRAAWTQKYGQDRATMPAQPNVSTATAAEQAAALDLLQRTEAATAAYAEPAVAQAAGYDFAGALAKAEAKRPGRKAQFDTVAQGTIPKKGMPMLHVANQAYAKDGKVLDPSAPETLMYMAQPGGGWKLVGVMFKAGEAYPTAPPTPGGPITRWHYHAKDGQATGLMMHLFFTPGNDLATAYATSMSKTPMPSSP